MITEAQYTLAMTRHRAFSEVLGKYSALFAREDRCLHEGTLTEQEHIAVCRGLNLARAELQALMGDEAAVIEVYRAEQKAKREEEKRCLEKKKQ